MVSMKRILLVGALVGSTLLTGYRVFAGPGEQVMTCAPELCQPTEECQKQCGPCDPRQCDL